MKYLKEWRRDIITLAGFLIFAFLINRGIAIRGLFMDDLYLWSCFGEQSFFQFVFPLGSTRFRFLYYIAAWLELALVGPNIGWIVPLNIILNAMIAFTIYRMAKVYSRSYHIGTFCGIAYLMSRFSYYQIGQVYGLMETMGLWLAIWILFLLNCCLTGPTTPGREEKGEYRTERTSFYIACILYFAVCFVHERYMVLIPLFFLVLAFRRCREPRRWLAPAASFLLMQLLRMVTTKRLVPAGTGKTEVTETFSAAGALKYAFSQIAYLFGFNAGPEYLNGENFREAPLWITGLIILADLMLLGLLAAFILKMIRDWKKCGSYLPSCILFLGFIAGCIACSSVTIRVEMRWVYVSYAAALLFLSWMYGVLTEDLDRKMARYMQAAPYMAMALLYVVLMFPVELYYRSNYPNLYFWPEQSQYNSLAEATYGTYGDEIFGKKIYLVGDSYEMSEFTDETFFKVFDKERRAEGTEVHHISDVREIGLVTDDMLVLQEDPARNRYLDITLPVRMLKCRGISGYYADGWMDEHAEIQVMTGKTGEINMSFYYPGEITGDEWMSIYVDGDPKEYMKFTGPQMAWTWTTKPYRTVNLKFETNFYVKNAQEQRGEKKLAVILGLVAD